MPIHKFTQARLEKIVREKKPGIYGDGGKLWLQISPTGSASWLFRYRLNGRARAAGLGPLHTVGLAQAREAARKLRLVVHEGRDPIDERGAQRKAQAFDKVTELFFEKSTEPNTGWASMLAKYASPVIGKLPVDQITPDHLLRILSPIWHMKVDTAVRLRRRIEKVLTFATHVLRQRSGDNPARWEALSASLAPLKRVRQKVKRKPLAAMPYGDVPSFLPRLRERTEIEARGLEFVILTAVRTGDIVGQKARKNTPAKPPLYWSAISLDDKTWTIAATKTDVEHIVPLSDAAVAVLQVVKSLKLDAERVFPMGKNAMLNLLGEMAPGLTVHGFRSCFKTWTDEETNVHPDVVETCLAHKVVGDEVEKAYRRGAFFEKRRELMAAWANYLAGTGANVVPLKRPEAAADNALESEPKDDRKTAMEA